MILTETEINELSDLIERSDFFDCVVPFARAIEAAILKKIGEPVAERDHWKNNHATEVRRARILKERPDLPIERVQAYEKWRKDQDERDYYKEECLEQARLLGISGERELKLIAEREDGKWAADRIEQLEAENEKLSLYKNLADEYGLSVFADLAELQKQRDELLEQVECSNITEKNMEGRLNKLIVQNAATKDQRDELLTAAEAIEINAEECLDWDDCTAMLVSIDSYHKLMEAVASMKGASA